MSRRWYILGIVAVFASVFILGALIAGALYLISHGVGYLVGRL